MVEYGTAIVVASDGDLIAPAHAADECQAITVPPFGHAERIAEDKTDSLALIRLYGARNLTPAALAADSGQPGRRHARRRRRSAGSGRRRRGHARRSLTAQGIAPAPKLGFSGAAASIRKAASPAWRTSRRPLSPAAVLPAIGDAGAGGAIRAFLQAQHVALATAATAPGGQSVVRVICVRKNGYLFSNFGGRFSMKAAMPSFWSAVANSE